MATIKVNTDGGARGNPGPAGIGVVITLPEGRVIEKQRGIGVGTNNQAEYLALLWATHLVYRYVDEGDEVVFILDSELVVKQMKGEYKIKDAQLQVLNKKVEAELQRAKYKFSFQHVLRDQNARADALVKRATKV